MLSISSVLPGNQGDCKVTTERMAHSVGINNPPVRKTDTQEAENLDKAIFS
jgi:hypothetical protein